MPQVKYMLHMLLDPEADVIKAQEEVNASIKLLQDQEGIAGIDVKVFLSTNMIMMPTEAKSGGVITAESQAPAITMAMGTQIFLLTCITWWTEEEVGEEEGPTPDKPGKDAQGAPESPITPK